MKVAVFLLALVCSALAGPIQKLDALEEFTAGNRLFTAGVYKNLQETNKNLIVSPFSAETVLTLAYEGAKGETAEELITGLSLPSSEEKIQTAFKSFLPKLKGSADDHLSFSTANKIFVAEDVDIGRDFKMIAQGVFDSDVEAVNFAESMATANEINEWVESQTNHKIKNLVDPSSLGDDTEIILVNAIYFSGEWALPFVQFPMIKGSFHGVDEDADVEFLHEKEYLNYYENEELNAKFLELPIKGGDVEVVFVLPNEEDGLSALEENILEVLKPQPVQKTGVDVEIPKFTIESEVEFVPILHKLGVHKLFSVEADLSGIAANKALHISSVVQKAFIKVTESGVEAAAATDVIGPTSVVSVTAEFKADRPFLYYIKNEGVVIFAGRYVQP